MINIDQIITDLNNGALVSRATVVEMAQTLAAMSKAATDVLTERRRQIDVKGWDHVHDDAQKCGEISAFASIYAMPEAARDWDASSTSYGETFAEALCPNGWAPNFKGRRSDLVKAGALILAEIERIDRAAK